jgi:hypothetical protein
MARFLLALVVLAGLVVAYFWAALSWSYSSGERAGWVQKLSNKGWVCKTWEGELALVSLPGSSVEKFHFTVRDEAVAKEIMQAMGKRVSLHYEEKVGLPTNCFGETRHFVSKVIPSAEIPIGPGITMPVAPAPASTPAMPAAPAAPAPAASRP